MQMRRFLGCYPDNADGGSTSHTGLALARFYDRSHARSRWGTVACVLPEHRTMEAYTHQQSFLLEILYRHKTIRYYICEKRPSYLQLINVRRPHRTIHDRRGFRGFWRS